MIVAITFRSKSKNEYRKHEHDDFLFLACENEALTKSRQFFAPGRPWPFDCHA